MKKAAPTLLMILFLLAGLGSCKESPVACFRVTTPADSIKVGSIVRFDGSCSSDVNAYYWDFGNGLDTTSITAQTTYTTAANYTVVLVVGNSGKSASLTKTITVLP